MSTALGSPNKGGHLLVEFRYGDPTAPVYSRYTDLSQDTRGFSSKENLEIELAENVGTFDDRETRIVMPEDAFSGNAANGLPHSPIFVRVIEVTTGFGVDAPRDLEQFKGRVTRTVANFQGDNGMVAFFAKMVKSRIDVPMGLQCNGTCNWALFRTACALKRAEASHRAFGQIASMDGQEITVSANVALTAPSSPGGNVDRHWEKGFLEKDGLKIGIRIWQLSDPSVFVLRRRPPTDWLLAGATSIKFVPGCPKTIEGCREQWDNEENFMGLGYGMLDYNPMYERG
jgi:hypothetical protein